MRFPEHIERHVVMYTARRVAADIMLTCKKYMPPDVVDALADRAAHEIVNFKFPRYREKMNTGGRE